MVLYNLYVSAKHPSTFTTVVHVDRAAMLGEPDTQPGLVRPPLLDSTPLT